ncbi:prolyl oligopeptidase family serine peptidase [Pseudoalteromonas sp. T1lg65]|uniref:S9 family peptidase n=1 Tax=Pseudoalteromonas sp. T1lg65 TaxID=2077101 RepID=UPI003F79EBEA
MKFNLSLLGLALLCANAHAAKPNLEFSDVFQFKSAEGTVLSEHGQFLGLSAQPYRGDGEGQLYDLETQKLIASVERGTKPTFSKNGAWVAYTQVPSLLAKETNNKEEKAKLKNTLILINTETLSQLTFDAAKDFQLSDNGKWLAYRHDMEENKSQDADKDTPETKEKVEDAIKADKGDKTYTLSLVNLYTQQRIELENIAQYQLAPNGTGVLINQQSTDGKDNQVGFYDLTSQKQSSLINEPGVTLGAIAWQPNGKQVAFYQGNYVNDDIRRRQYQLQLWSIEQNGLKTIATTDNWFSGKTATLTWSDDNQRLYFDTRPQLEAKIKEKKYSDESSLYDFDTIRAQKGLKVWHNQDPEIKPREQITWKESRRDKHFKAVFHIEGERVVQLETPEVASVSLNTNAAFLLASDDKPYLKQTLYEGFYRDYYAVNISNGETKSIVKKIQAVPTLSPTGEHAAYFKHDHVWLKSLSSGKETAISKAVKQAIFADDRHDYPMPNEGYGFAGWQSDGSTLYVYSKYDIWAFDTQTLAAKRLTNGYQSQTQYRVEYKDADKLGFSDTERLILRAHNLQNKQTHIALLSLDTGKLETVLNGEARFDVITKAKNADRFIITKQDYHTFPDFWVTNANMVSPKRVTNLNPQQGTFAWGQKPELVQYKGFDGEDLQGVLIKPADYKQGDKVPVVIYFYRYMSQRMYDFPKMELNHRPNFPMFTSNGYAIFLPDIRFEIGRPGPSSTQTMINAAQALIDMGVAHPDKIGLQGHSWAGYQSAFMVTQTNMFKAVVSGAPVSNMTSAYSGIRLKSGLARQFQYEAMQSRIGKTLTEAPELYIENSPVFFADKVNTPILIMFGDNDGAVPWQEGIQYYLALRRHDKDAILLQYEGEPHHLKKFPNQVDFSIRMMEYFDHHLKGKPAADWIIQGEKYQPES